MTAEDLLAEVEALGVTVQLVGDVLRFRPGSSIPRDLMDELRAHKPELVELVSLRGWPDASREAMRRHRRPEARLYPFLGQIVATPQGPGRLLQISRERAAVAFGSLGLLVYLLPSEVRPPDVAADPGQRFEVVH